MLLIGKIKLNRRSHIDLICLAYFSFSVMWCVSPKRKCSWSFINDAQYLKESCACRDGRILHLTFYPTTALCCMNLLGETWANVYSSKVGNYQQTKEMFPTKSNLVTSELIGVAFRTMSKGILTEALTFERQWHHQKTYLNLKENSCKMLPWIFLHNLQVAAQVR